jgi:uncharacterized protein (DUF1501 family)
MQILRRDFLKGLGALGAAGVLPGLSAINAYAQSANDYKALVCVFLFGGNDGNNTVVPMQAAEYDVYAAGRGGVGGSGIALAQSSLVPLNDAAGTRFGLHPNLAPLQQVWGNGDLGVLFNAGPLVQPTTRDQFRNNRVPRPINLLSHDDQQELWQSAISTASSSIGWGGRLADQVRAMNSGSTVPMNISVAGNDVFLVGNVVQQYSVPTGGQFGLAGFGNNAQSTARRNAMQQLMGMDTQKTLVKSAAGIIDGAVNASAALNSVVNNATAAVNPSFTANSGLSNQFRAVARMIEGRAALGLRRQIFFVSQGGYDTHQNQLVDQANRFTDLGASMRAFYNAMGAIGMQDAVTTFTLSDFGRTLRVNDGGSDHAWGNHQFVMGGAVRGGTYGSFPNLALSGPDDADRDGRWIPTTSVDQYAATLARWFGVPAADLAAVVPNIGRFPTADLGFLA